MAATKRPLLGAFRDETAFTDWTIDLFKLAGWVVHHDRGEMRRHIQGHAGYPDVCAARGPRIVFAELKMPGENPTEQQYRWIRVLRLNPTCEVYIWYPKDKDTIISVITGGKP